MPRDRVGGPRPFAGETVDLKPSAEHKSTQGVIGFLGHLPGVQNAIWVSYPTTAKQSKSYTDERKKEIAARQASPPRADRDKWGNLAIPRFSPGLVGGGSENSSSGGNAGVGSSSSSNTGGAVHQRDGGTPPSSGHASGGTGSSSSPGPLAGYMGHRRGVRDNYGVTFSKEVVAPRNA